MKKSQIIYNIQAICKKHGSFSVYDVEADHSPFLNTKGRLTHLIEEFRDDGCLVRVYDPTSHSSDEVDEYDEFYDEVSKSQLEYILELAENWAEQCREDNDEDYLSSLMYGVDNNQ